MRRMDRPRRVIDHSIRERKPTEPDNTEAAPLSVDEHVGKVDKVFHDLMAEAATFPEAKKAAVEILVKNMKQIAEQMKQSRDLRGLHEMKMQMMEQWDELVTLAGEDPELIGRIQQWGQDFIDQKVLYYDIIAEVQHDLTESSQEIQDAWDDMGAGLGQVSGMLGVAGNLALDHLGDTRRFELQSKGIQGFIENLTDMETGHVTSDVAINEANSFLAQLQRALIDLRAAAYHEAYPGAGTMAEKKPEVIDVLDKLVELKKTLSRKIKDVSNIARVLKKVQDTHFLELYNAPPPGEALAA